MHLSCVHDRYSIMIASVSELHALLNNDVDNCDLVQNKDILENEEDRPIIKQHDKS